MCARWKKIVKKIDAVLQHIIFVKTLLLFVNSPLIKMFVKDQKRLEPLTEYC